MENNRKAMMNIRKETAKRLEAQYNIEPALTDTLFQIGIIDEGAARNFLIKDDYKSQAQPGKKERTKIHLAETYACSFSTVEKIILKNFEEKQ